MAEGQLACIRRECWLRYTNKLQFLENAKKNEFLQNEKTCDLIRVEDDFCKTITSKNFYVYFVNAEDSKVADSLLIDVSSLLMAKGEQAKPSFSFESSTIKVMDIDWFEIRIEADKELLQETYRHFLNPLQVEVIGAKDVPLDTMNKYEPAYVKYSFFDYKEQTAVLTNPVAGNGMLLWNHKHVFLAGLLDPTELKEKIRSKYLKFELHDRDEIDNKKLKEDIELFNVTEAIEK